MLFRSVNIIFLVLVATSMTEARIKFKKLEITSDPAYLKIKYEMTERDNKPYLNVETEILQDIDGEIIVHGNVSAYHDGKIEPITRILPIDLCKYLSGEKKSVLLKLVWDEVGRFGNLPKACPIMKQTVTIKEFTPDKDMIPAALPGGEYHINIIGDLVKDGNIITTLEHTVVHATVDA